MTYSFNSSHRRVHISETTNKFLNGEFDLEEGHGGDREDELKLRNITTFFVKGVIKPVSESSHDASKMSLSAKN